jgi:hypothetical protein
VGQAGVGRTRRRLHAEAFGCSESTRWAVAVQGQQRCRGGGGGLGHAQRETVGAWGGNKCRYKILIFIEVHYTFIG